MSEIYRGGGREVESVREKGRERAIECSSERDRGCKREIEGMSE